jgi:hypothetical protein
MATALGGYANLGLFAKFRAQLNHGQTANGKGCLPMLPMDVPGREVRQPAVAYPDQAAPIVRVPDRGVWGAKEQILWLISGVKRSPSISGTPMASWTFQFLTESPSALVEYWAPRPATPINYP